MPVAPRFPDSLVALDTPDPATLTLDPDALNAVPAPRLVRPRRGAQQGHRILSCLLSVALLVWAFLTVGDLLRLRSLAERGVTAEASVFGVAPGAGSRGPYRRWFRFVTADGRTVTGWQPISQQEYAATRAGDRLTVTHLPGEPAVHEVGAVDRARIAGRAVEWAGWGLAVAALFGVPMLWVKAGLQRQVRLLRDGTAVAGDVTSIKTKQTNYGPSFVLRYRYTARDGAEHSGSLPVSLAVRDRYVGPGPGKSLTVLYDRNNPRDSVPYAYAASFAELERDERRAASRAGSSESNLSASASVSGRLQ